MGLVERQNQITSGKYAMKIFSMSVFGTQARYIQGAFRQTELCEKYFPGWQVRIYTDRAENFLSLSGRAKIIEVTDGSYGVFWRFAPMFESPDNIVVVRDSDSRITIREQQAVNEWIQSDKNFHVIKDHESHYQWAINAGMFAYRGQLDAHTYSTMLAYANRSHSYTIDQIWLQEHVWPNVKNSCMIHSMQSDTWFAQTRNMLQNPFSFVGNGYDEHDMPLYPNKLIHMWTSDLVEPKFRFDEGILMQ